MKAWFVVLCVGFFGPVQAQYFYKDIIGTRQSAAQILGYRANKVRTVTLKSFTVNNTPIDELVVEQSFSPDGRLLQTITRTAFTPASYLSTEVDTAGNVIKTTDSSDGVVNTTRYRYRPDGKLATILFTAGDTLAAVKTDDHHWTYDAQGRIQTLLRIKNGRDTAVVSFKLDEKGNVVEEQERRRAIAEEPYYYYYDEANRLTDIVRYNKKAGRLLPESMFEYSANDQVIQQITVPQKSSDYLIWRYAYNAQGLKTREVIFTKQKEQTGRVDYQYTFDR